MCAGGLPTAGSAANVDHYGARQAEIYNPANAVGQRWSGLLADSQVDRLAHSTAFLTMNGEVGPLCSLALHCALLQM